MAERYSSEAQRRNLKLRTRDLIRANGGLEAASDFTRPNRAALSNHQSLAHPEMSIPADAVLDLELRAGEPLVTAVLARAQGYHLVAAEPLDGAGYDAIVDTAARAGRREADRVAATLEAIADGTLDAAELEALIAASDAALRLEQRLNDLLRRHRGPGTRRKGR